MLQKFCVDLPFFGICVNLKIKSYFLPLCKDLDPWHIDSRHCQGLNFMKLCLDDKTAVIPTHHFSCVEWSADYSREKATCLYIVTNDIFINPLLYYVFS